MTRWIPWLTVTLLAASCCALAILQYRWIDQFSTAQRDQLKQDLQNRLSLLSRGFDDEISAAVTALIPNEAEIDRLGRERAYASHYQASGQSAIRRVALAIPDRGVVSLEILNPDSGEFVPREWPAEWSVMRDQLTARTAGEPVPPSDPRSPYLFEIPRFGGGPGHQGEQEWLVVELNSDYLRATLLPEMRKKYLGDNFDFAVALSSDPSAIVSGTSQIVSNADASVAILENQAPRPGPSRGRPPEKGRRSFGPPARDFGRRGGPSQQFSPQGRWRLYAQHRAGSLETLVARTRWRNIAASSALLLLILAAMAALLRVSRQAQRLAELQMNFVAGVSHELRTPLAVIRTAAFNLRGRLGQRPDQVERYGKLIQHESEKLTALVEQVLRFAGSEAGHAIRDREPVAIENIVESALDSTRQRMEEQGVILDKRIAAPLAPVLADRFAMQHALQNLLENAMKYGHNWIGLTVSSAGPFVEIRIADRGPGIPAEEQEHIFDPFFRGRRAISDQIHGTGLGLSLVKRIVEAHGGTIQVYSEPLQGTEFIVRLPSAPAEEQREFAHSLS
jgi:signal transduction histidine kinase